MATKNPGAFIDLNKLPVLRRAVDLLDARTKEAVEVLSTVQNCINDIHPGVRAWVDGEIDVGGNAWRIGYGKAKGAWCLLASRDGVDDMPLLEAPRHVRAVALSHLDAVLDAVIARVNAIANDVERNLQR